MNSAGESIMSIATAIIGVAILALIISRKSNTVGVIQAGASGFVNALATAVSPVTGSTVNINSSYPGSAGTFGGGNFGFNGLGFN